MKNRRFASKSIVFNLPNPNNQLYFIICAVRRKQRLPQPICYQLYMQTRLLNKSVSHLSFSEGANYEIESILDSRRYFGHKYYLIKWRGFSVENSSWEPLDHLGQVIQAVLCFDYLEDKSFQLRHQRWRISRLQKQMFRVLARADAVEAKQKLQQIVDQQIFLFQQLQKLELQFKEKEAISGMDKLFKCNENKALICNKKLKKLYQKIDKKGKKFCFEIHCGQIKPIDCKIMEEQSKMVVKLCLKALINIKDHPTQVIQWNHKSGPELIKYLNSEQMIQSRTNCASIIAASFFKDFYSNVLHPIRCQSASFYSYTASFLAKSELKAIKSLQIQKICTQQEAQMLINQQQGQMRGQRLKIVDLQTLLVYYPSQLLAFLHKSLPIIK